MISCSSGGGRGAGHHALQPAREERSEEGGDRTRMRHDLAYLARLSDEIDRLVERGLLFPELARRPADLRDYFIYLTLDALEDPELARKLVWSFKELRSRTHRKFFFILERLLSVRHEIAGLPGEKISREAFERSWERTRRDRAVRTGLG